MAADTQAAQIVPIQTQLWIFFYGLQVMDLLRPYVFPMIQTVFTQRIALELQGTHLQPSAIGSFCLLAVPLLLECLPMRSTVACSVCIAVAAWDQAEVKHTRHTTIVIRLGHERKLLASQAVGI